MDVRDMRAHCFFYGVGRRVYEEALPLLDRQLIVNDLRDRERKGNAATRRSELEAGDLDFRLWGVEPRLLRDHA